MKIYSNFDELYADLRGKLPIIKPKKIQKIIVSEDMTKAELLAVAEREGIEVPKKATKAEIVKTIRGEK